MELLPNPAVHPSPLTPPANSGESCHRGPRGLELFERESLGAGWSSRPEGGGWTPRDPGTQARACRRKWTGNEQGRCSGGRTFRPPPDLGKVLPNKGKEMEFISCPRRMDSPLREVRELEGRRQRVAGPRVYSIPEAWPHPEAASGDGPTGQTEALGRRLLVRSGHDCSLGPVSLGAD